MLLRKSTGIPGETGSKRESGIEAGMYECAEAVYQNEIWRAASLKDENGNYKQELRLKMKKESQKHCFSCPECGVSLILNAGISGSLISAIMRAVTVCLPARNRQRETS